MQTSHTVCEKNSSNKPYGSMLSPPGSSVHRMVLVYEVLCLEGVLLLQ